MPYTLHYHFISYINILPTIVQKMLMNNSIEYSRMRMIEFENESVRRLAETFSRLFSAITVEFLGVEHLRSFSR